MCKSESYPMLDVDWKGRQLFLTEIDSVGGGNSTHTEIQNVRWRHRTKEFRCCHTSDVHILNLSISNNFEPYTELLFSSSFLSSYFSIMCRVLFFYFPLTAHQIFSEKKNNENKIEREEVEVKKHTSICACRTVFVIRIARICIVYISGMWRFTKKNQ